MRNFRIALVEASSYSTNFYSRKYLPRVGIPTLGAILKGLGYECDIWFQAMEKVDVDKLRQYDLVGIGSLTNTITEAYRIADYLKNTGPAVVMGGPHVTFMYEEALEHCDYVVIGEGDVTFPALVGAIAEKEPADDIPGIAFRGRGGDVKYTGVPEPVNLEDLPSPDFTLSGGVDADRPPPIVVTSRGCPHNCIFCSVTAVFGRRYRFNRNEQVLDALRPVLNQSVCFGDDNFFANPVRTKKLLREMIEKNSVPLRWSAQMCVKDASDIELLELMRETRCRIVYVGVESTDTETLRSLGKAHEADAIRRSVQNLHKYDIGIHGMFIVNVDDTVDTPRKIVDYAIATDIDTIQICALSPLPGTEAYLKYGRELLHRDWLYFDGMHVVTRPEKCSAHEMQLAIVEEMKRFYSLKRLIGAYRSGRRWRVKYRAGGYYLIRRWLGENAEYMNRLKRGF
jgi:radical SAM superfamily enzyme YgiQ (UPF0313 family)